MEQVTARPPAMQPAPIPHTDGPGPDAHYRVIPAAAAHPVRQWQRVVDDVLAEADRHYTPGGTR